MPIPEAEFIWFNGEMLPWSQAQIHVLSHVVSYGSSIFEGIRAYATPQGPAVFRLEPHVRRLFDSAHIYRMEIPYSQEQIATAICETVRVNHLPSAYIRPLVFRGYRELGVNPLHCPLEVVIAAFEWGRYLGEEALEEGVDVCVSSWNRMAPNTFPAMAKSGANYMNAQLIKMEALRHGYVEGIALDVTGYVSEGSGENLFVLRDGHLYTPPLANSILPGITRDAVMLLAREQDIPVIERTLPREFLYIADEAFFSGTAAEITPIRSIDGIPVGAGRRGPLTAQLQQAFFDIVEGRVEDRHGWLTPVEE
ncbi:MAG: branched-chain amino acid transaminase [Chloroflexia bacterium]|nr:branched-chain amino acid transaminase [Chloroflexia bacterium]